LYIPEGDYNKFVNEAKSIFPGSLKCDSASMPCYFEKKCSDSGIPSEDIQFKLKLYDGEGNQRDIILPK